MSPPDQFSLSPDTAEEAVKIHRELAKTNPAFLNDLAMALREALGNKGQKASHASLLFGLNY